MCRYRAALLTLLILDACTSTTITPQLPIRAIPRPQRDGTWEIYEQYAQCNTVLSVTFCRSGALYINHNALESAYYCRASGYVKITVTCSQIDVQNSSQIGGGIIPGEVKLLSSRSPIVDAGSGSADDLWKHNYWIANGTVPGVAFCYLYLSPSLEAICKAATFDNLP
jgi:hypothetical protein